jgi:hypothetical protein
MRLSGLNSGLATSVFNGTSPFLVVLMAHRIARSIKQLGWHNAGLHALARSLAWASGGRWTLHKYRFVAQSTAVGGLSRGRGKKIEVRLYRRHSELPLAYPRPREVLRQRYEQGAQSLAAFSGEQLIGFLWLLYHSYQEDEVRARYTLASAQAAWDFDVWIRPEDRLGFAFARLWDEANGLLRAHSVRWSCSRISAFNSSSLNAHARIGTVILGSATFLRCGRWQWMCSTLAPYVHLSRHPASFPQFCFDTSGLAQGPSMEPSCSTLKK